MSDDDDDMATLFRARREASLAKRANNREHSTNMLREKNIFYTTHNNGVHLIVMEHWNFWPGTGKFTERRGKPGRPPRQGRGVRRLIDLIEQDQGVQNATPV